MKKGTSMSVLAKLTVNFNGTVAIPDMEQQVSLKSGDPSQTFDQICDGLDTFGKLAGELLSEMFQ